MDSPQEESSRMESTELSHSGYVGISGVGSCFGPDKAQHSSLDAIISELLKYGRILFRLLHLHNML